MKQRISLLIAAQLLLSSAAAQGVEAKSAYAGRHSSEGDFNQSYLANIQTSPMLISLNQTLYLNPNNMLSSNEVSTMRQKYEDMNRDYDMRKNQGLVDAESERSHLGRLSGFSQGIVNQLESKGIVDQKRKMQPGVDQLTEDLRNNKEIMSIIKPALLISTPVAFYFGQPVELKISDTSKISAKANGPGMTGQLDFSSQIVNASLIVNNNALEARDPAGTFSADPLSRSDERYKLSFSSPVRVWDLNTSLYYISTSKVVDASISKTIAPHVTCVIDSFYPVAVDYSDVKIAGSTIRAQYEIHF